MLAQEYWNEIGSKKDFEDPVYLDKLSKFLSPASKIVEYGCGYGRMMRILKTGGYENLIGFDFAPNMIARGQKENPDLDLRLLKTSGAIPFEDESLDAVMMSTVLCCMVDKAESLGLMRDILRVLKKKGILYITDFLVCEHPRYQERYAQGAREFGEWGIYTTNENLTVRHYTTHAIMDLLKEFDIKWFEQFDFKTMNQNPACTFHCIARK
ncbi:MAG: class I SAM-dependent methyltransferase [Verrucomicrobia bacterium]|nr:class I SAM-dependent methyltransferase [Verrucomicrobiota bacterium]